MTDTDIHFPTADELVEIRREATKKQAEAIACGARAIARWVAHPTLRLRHA